MKVAIVDDDADCTEKLKGHILKYCRQHGEEVKISTFSDGIDIASDYTADYDIIFLDIVMPHLNGLRTAEYIRRMDKFAVIVFISADARYAVSGYAYEALAFLVKPITYENFAIEFKRCLEKVNDGKRRYVVFSTDNGMDRISIDKILYIESLGHRMAINTSDHTYYIYETLTSLEEKLPAKQFSRCNNCYLVNLAHVNGVHGEFVILDGVRLKVSRSRRKGFMEDLSAYFA